MFIYRGEELETLAAFTTRIRHDFPNAEVRNDNNNEVLVAGMRNPQVFQVFQGFFISQTKMFSSM